MNRTYIIPPIVVVAPQVAMVTVPEAKAYLNIGFSEDDAIILGMCTAAQQMLSRVMATSFSTQDLKITFSYRACDGRMRLPYGPVVSISGAMYKECECPGEAFSSTDNYCLIGDYFKSAMDGVFEVTYTAGPVPDQALAKNLILKQVAWMYENRGDERQKSINPDIEITGGSISRNLYI